MTHMKRPAKTLYSVRIAPADLLALKSVAKKKRIHAAVLVREAIRRIVQEAA